MVYCGQRGWRQSEGGIRGTLLGTVAEPGINKGKKKSDERRENTQHTPKMREKKKHTQSRMRPHENTHSKHVMPKETSEQNGAS